MAKLTVEHVRLAHDLSRCTFLPGSYEKRFAHDASFWTTETEVTDKQLAFLEKVGFRYRRQLGYVFSDRIMARDGARTEAGER